MSDIDLLPGIGLLLVSLWMLMFSALVMVILLIVAACTQRRLPWRCRLAMQLLIGMLPAFFLAWIGIGVVQWGPRELGTAFDLASMPFMIEIASIPLLLGIGWGLWRYKKMGSGRSAPKPPKAKRALAG